MGVPEAVLRGLLIFMWSPVCGVHFCWLAHAGPCSDWHQVSAGTVDGLP